MGKEVDIILSSGLTFLGDKLIQYGKESASQMEIYKTNGVTVQQRNVSQPPNQHSASLTPRTSSSTITLHRNNENEADFDSVRLGVSGVLRRGLAYSHCPR